MKAKHLLSVLAALLLLGSACQRTTSQQPGRSATVKNENSVKEVTWQLTKDNSWQPSSTPPPCPDPVRFAMPADLTKVVAILYPGQVRGDAYKPHGGIRFSDQTKDNQAAVTIPFDAKIIQGSRGFRNGENQYSFVFINPCGIYYTLGHLLELTPKFLAIANSLPLVDDDTEGFHLKQFYDVQPPVSVAKGEVIATAVGYAKQHNVFFDFGVFDLRHKNGYTISPEWSAKYGEQFDHYAICWLDVLAPADAAQLRLLPSGTVESGNKSDYCH